MSRKSDSQKNEQIQVFARCRPLTSFEAKQRSPSMVEVIPEKKKLVLKDRNTLREYSFNGVFSQDSEQIAVYMTVVEPMIHDVLLGYHCTVFAYGQTGTGKTYTMEGERSNAECTWENDPGAGIIPRSMHQLYEELHRLKNVEFSVSVSFLEIHNESVYDLLGKDFSKLCLYEDPSLKDSVKAMGLEEILVKDKEEIYAILKKGASKRHTAETVLNAISSRSHTIFTVTVNITEKVLGGEKIERCGKLNLVDLAGSENVRRSKAVDKRESGHINQSLLTLGRVITSLRKKQAHVPYRESKLTRMLQYSLGGHAKTAIIVTFSPALCSLDETISTLEYATTAQAVKIKPEVKSRMLRQALIKSLTEENERLHTENSSLLKDLKAARDKQGFFIDAENHSNLINKITLQDKEIKALKSENAKLQRRANDVDKLFEKLERKQAAAYANEDFCAKLRMLSQQQCAVLQGMVAGYAKEAQQFSASLKDDQSQMNDVLTKHKRKTNALCETICSEFRLSLDGFSSKLQEQAVCDILWINDLSHDMNSMKNMFVLHCDEFLKKRLPSLSDDINAECSSMNNRIISIHKSLEEKVHQHKSALEIQYTEGRKYNDMLTDKLDSFFINHNEAMNDYSMDIQSSVTECQDQISNILKSFAVVQEHLDETVQLRNISLFESNASQLRTVKEPLNMLESSFSTTEAQIEEYSNILEHVALNKFLQNRGSTVSVISEVSSMEELLSKLYVDDYQKVASNLDSHNSTVQDNLQDNIHALNAGGKTLSGEMEEKKDCLVAQVETLENISAHSREVIVESKNRSSEAAQKKKEEIMREYSGIQKTLSEGLFKDIPTGTTPHQKPRKSPKHESFYTDRIKRRLSSKIPLMSCFKGNDDNDNSNTSYVLDSKETSLVSDMFDLDGCESESSMLSAIRFNGKSKENCPESRRSSLPPRRKSFRISGSSEIKPLSPHNQVHAGCST